jgi:hypothetical protein
VQEVGGQLLRQCHSARLSSQPLCRTLSMDECSSRSSPTMGGGNSVERPDWRRCSGQGALGDSDDNGDSPGSLEGFLLISGAG